MGISDLNGSIYKNTGNFIETICVFFQAHISFVVVWLSVWFSGKEESPL